VVWCTQGAVAIEDSNGSVALKSFDRAHQLLGATESADRFPGGHWVSCESGRASALSLLGRHDEALNAFDNVLEVDPTCLDRYDEVKAFMMRLESR
jgi:tetratricopeptide (TPR) repeat protein